MSNKNKKSRRFNFLDALIIIVIVVGILFGANKYRQASVSSSGSSPKTSKIKVSYFIEEVPDYAAESIEIGDPVKEKIQNSNFGEVIDKEIGESVSWARNDQGQFTRSKRDGYASLTITMEANGIMGDNGVTIDKSIYYIGQTVTLHAGNSVLTTGRISDIRLAE